MRLDINLATHRYEDAGQFWIRWGLGLGVVGIATLALLVITISGLRDAHSDHKKIADLEAKIAERDQERARAEALLKSRSAESSVRNARSVTGSSSQRLAYHEA